MVTNLNPKRYWNGRRGKGEAMQWLRDHAAYDKPYCLIWPYSSARGYGNFSFLGEMMYAHRVMCELAHGRAPSPMHQAAHNCGNGEKGCVNPHHIEWKTPSQNQLDKSAHGTANRNGRRKKVSDGDVLRIRAMAGQRTHDELARLFGVSRRNIGMIINGHSRTSVQSVSGQSAIVTPECREPGFE